MHIRYAEQDSFGNPIRGSNIYHNCHTGHADWGDCTRCSLSVGRRRVCIRYDGRIDCPTGTGRVRLMFVGKSPGKLENWTGVPFVGTSGRPLRYLFEQIGVSFDYCLTNLVGCYPQTIVSILDKEGKPVQLTCDDEQAIKEINYNGYTLDTIDEGRNPTIPEIRHCSPHLEEIRKSFNPNFVIFLHPIARMHYTPPGKKIDATDFEKIEGQEYKILSLKRLARKIKLEVTAFLDSINQAVKHQQMIDQIVSGTTR